MLRKILLLLFGACLLAPIAKAEEAADDAKVSVHLNGVGGLTCAHWRSSSAARAEGTVWIFGFWSGLNYVAAATQQPQSNAPEKEIVAEVVRVCMANPSQVLASAAWAAYLNLSKQ